MVVNINKIFFIVFICLITNSYASNSMQIIRDSEIEFFLQKLINNIIKNSNETHKTLYPRLISNNNYNAFVTGTNKIYVHTGLINQARSIDEIQGVLAHEIGHLFLKHHNSRLINRKNSSRYNKIAAAAGIALTLAGKLDAKTATGLIIGGQDLGIKSYLQFSRVQETQADAFALEVIKKSKISYFGIEHLLNRLSEEQFLNETTQSNYYRSHPFSQSRLEQFKRYKNKFLKKQKEKKYILFQKNEVSLAYINNKIVSYDKDAFEIITNNSDKNNFFSRYSLIIAYLKTGKYDLAIKNLNIIKNNYKNYPYFYELAGDIYFNKGDLNKAIQNYKNALKTLQKDKVASNTLIKFSLARSFLQTNEQNNIKKAINLLEELILFEPNWSYLWRLIAQGSGKINNKGISYIALAEEAMIKNNFKKAKKYVDIGLRDTLLPTSYRLRGNDINARIKIKQKR